MFLQEGDIIKCDFSGSIGHEQSGVRPAVVVSQYSSNANSGLAMVCPVTSRTKGYFAEAPVKNLYLDGVVLTNQLRTIDYKARKVEVFGTINNDILLGIRQKIMIILGMSTKKL